MPNFSSLVKKFNKVKVLIVGDIMLDRYFWGSVERISPEAPVPVVKLEKSSLVVGGAANVAANVAGLGAIPYLVGITGDDDEAKLYKPLLNNLNIDPNNLVRIKDRPTTVKTRIVAHNQHVVRLDQEVNHPINHEQENLVWKKLNKALNHADIVIVSDYSKGLLTEDLLERLIMKCGQMNKKILADPKGKNYSKYKGVDLITPNRFEAAQACDLSSSDQTIVEKAGNLLLRNLEIESVLITQGESGMTLFRNNLKSFHLNALARKVYDVTGAGDTVIASLGVAIGSGASLEDAARIANISAGIVVEEIGTTTITANKLKKYFEK